MRTIALDDFDWSRSSHAKRTFEAIFPNGVAATVENARKAQRFGLSLKCAARTLLAGEAAMTFWLTTGAALKEYKRSLRPTIRALNQWERLARNEHRSKGVRALLKQELAAATKEFEAVRKTKWEAYQELVAQELAKALEATQRQETTDGR